MNFFTEIFQDREKEKERERKLKREGEGGKKRGLSQIKRSHTHAFQIDVQQAEN
jgi:hypothetical protein